MFAVGFLFRKSGFLPESFFAASDRLVFKAALPALIFTQLAFADKTTSGPEDLRMVLFCVVGVLVTVVVPMLFLPLFVKSKPIRGAWIQGVYRSNFAILGVPFAKNLFGAEGGRIATIMLAVAVPLYNILAVIVLSLHAPTEKKSSAGLVQRAVDLIRDIVCNPLIIAVVLALPFYLWEMHLPIILTKSIGYLADLSTPLALLAIGANFSFRALHGKIGLACGAAVFKTVLFPALAVACAVLCGFSGAHLGIVFIAFGSPTAVSSYIMAKNMGSDHMLASQIIMLTTLFSIATIFLGSFLMRTWGVI